MFLTFLSLLFSLEYEDHISYKYVRVKHSDIKDFPNMHMIHIEQSKETHFSIFLWLCYDEVEKERKIDWPVDLHLPISSALANERQSTVSVFFQLWVNSCIASIQPVNRNSFRLKFSKTKYYYCLVSDNKNKILFI